MIKTKHSFINIGNIPHHLSSRSGVQGLLLALASLLMLIGFLFTTPVHATPNAEDSETIEYLIGYVSESDMVFVRNFGNHKPARAASHIRNKYDHFVDDIDSPEEFIELCASKSLITGREYKVIDPAGNEIKTRDWLIAALKDYRDTKIQASSE